MQYDESFDLVIVGSGAASVPAALLARSLGHSALIVEKQPVFGGSTAYSGGVLWIPNSPLHASGDSEEAGREYLNALIGPDGGKASPPAKREMFLKEGPQAIKFLMRQGLKFILVFWPDYYSNVPGAHEYGRSLMCELFNINELGDWKDKVGSFYGFPPLPVNCWEFVNLTLAKRTLKGKSAALRLAARMLQDKLTGRRRVGSGNALQGRMLQAALRAQIPIRLSTAVTELIVDGDRVAGVKISGPTGEQYIQAKRGVLLNTGGFSHNLAMRKAYQPAPASVDWTMANPGDTGEGIQMAQKLGADIDLMREAWWTPGSLLPNGRYAGFHVPGESGKPHIIIVGKNGRRVGNEAGAYMEFGQKMFAAGAVPAYAILDSRALAHYTWGPILKGAQIQPFIDNGYLKTATTVRELAQRTGIDPQGLEAEIAKFNGFAEKGVDADFGRGNSVHNRAMGDPTVKPNPSLGTIEKAPFYAVTIWPMDVGTSGGLVTDEYARVLRSDGSVIRGLYASGNTTAPVIGASYPGAGASIGASLTFGYVAARHALGDLNEERPNAGASKRPLEVASA
jgi:3-oxosteroid 1-dehydrogenase